MSTNIQRLKAFLYFCVILMTISGIAAASDRNVIIGFKNKTVGSNEDNVIHGYGGAAKKNFHLIPAIAASINESKIDDLKKDPRVAYIENDSIYQVSDEYTNAWGVKYIGSQPVHNQSINGTGVKIAVLDTGIDCNHEDLKNNCNSGYDFYFRDSNTSDDSYNSHGTHVSGIIAAEKNGIGIVGVAPNASLYAVKIMGSIGTYASAIISGIDWAVQNNTDIITMSLQGPYSQALEDAVNTAYNDGLLIVAAAGNTHGGAVAYPAAFDNVIAVTAIDQNGQRASFSPIDPKIELAAPGVNINSTIVGGYGVLSGTSMAAPYVTGVAALIMSTDFPDVNGDGVRNNIDVRQILDNTAIDIGSPGKDEIYGYGIVDASNATLGYSSYADLSITIDDGVSTITADGKTYSYTITVKNNGPSDASGVKVFDTWPIGFTRGIITPSQGTCDTAVNFTCDLGSIAKDGTTIITVGYTVPITSIGNYTNRVEVNSTNTDYNTSNNIAEDKNNVLSSFVDLSIAMDDGVSMIVAGDGKTYNYTITVKNNGPSDASGVKVFDTWPIGFTRGIITPSQGTCDTADNFTCDLGNIAKDGTAIITVGYTVPITSVGNYTNRVEVNSTNTDYNTSNNIAEDKNNVDILLVLVKKVKDKYAKNVTLLKGNYSITISNTNLSKIDINVYENGKFRKDLSAKYELKKLQVINFNRNIVSPKLDIEFIPYGDIGSTANIRIRLL